MPDLARSGELWHAWTPDVVAISDSDRVAIEIKSRREPDWLSGVERAARAVESTPGWRYELVVADAEEAEEAAQAAELLEQGEVLRHRDFTTVLLDEGHQDAAVLLGWAAFEAALLDALLPREPNAARFPPLKKLKYAVSLGLLEDDEHRTLSDFLSHRHAIAHGYRNARGGGGDPVAELRIALSLVDRLVEAGEEARQSRGEVE